MAGQGRIPRRGLLDETSHRYPHRRRVGLDPAEGILRTCPFYASERRHHVLLLYELPERERGRIRGHLGANQRRLHDFIRRLPSDVDHYLLGSILRVIISLNLCIVKSVKLRIRIFISLTIHVQTRRIIK